MARAVILLVCLFVFAIPWWWQWLPAWGERVIWGAPFWFVTSVVGSLVISVVTARYLSAAWDGTDLDDDSAEASGGTSDG